MAMKCFDDIRGIWRREGPVGRTVIAAMLVAAVIYGGSKPGLRSAPPPNEELTIGNMKFGEAEQALGMACVTDPIAMAGLGFWVSDYGSFDANSNAVARASWMATGVYDDYFTMTPPADAPVRIGTNNVLRLMVFSHGYVRAVLENGRAARLEPFHAPMSFIAQGKWAECGVTSLCWTASSAESTIVAWENALLERDTTRPLSFQIEFLSNGNFTYRYGDTDAIGALTNATFSIGPLCGPVPPCERKSTTGAIARASSLHFADISAYGDGTGDVDADGLSDYAELMIHGTNPRMGDTDGDGLADGLETAALLNPLDFDTDGDGLADEIDPEPRVSCGSAFGQSAAWVSATFPNGAEILATGYGNWLQSAIGGDGGRKRYVFTVSLSEVGEGGKSLIRVGGQAVVADAPGDYAFLLRNGPVHAFSVSGGAATFCASNPEALITVMRGGTTGTVVVLAGGVEGSPAWQHYSTSGESHSFSAVCVGADDGVVDGWHWSCAAGDVIISSPGSRITDIAWNWTNETEVVTWQTRNVAVSCRIGDWAATNHVTLHRGTHLEPQTTLSISMPPYFMVSNSVNVTVSYHTDIPVKGTVIVESQCNDADILASDISLQFGVSENMRDYEWQTTLEAKRNSATVGDIQLNGECRREDNIFAVATVSGTAVAFDRIIIPSAAPRGLAVLRGTQVPMEIAYMPTNAVLDEYVCVDWFTSRRHADNSHGPWTCFADSIESTSICHPAETGGIYRIKANIWLDDALWTVNYRRESFNKAVDPDSMPEAGYIGIASTLEQITLRETAMGHLGEVGFARAAYLPSYYGFNAVTNGHWKCNAFVAYCICEAGLTVEQNISPWHGNVYPPSANKWARKRVDDWAKVSGDLVEPGLVVGHPANGHGHCGIVDYDGYGIAAGETNVNRRFEGFLDGSCGFNRWTGEYE